MRKKTKEEVISSFEEKHNNFYNYDKFVYINAHTKSIITRGE